MRLNEFEDPRVAEGMARVAKLDGDIAALRKRIAELENDKSKIQTEIAKVTGQDAQEQQEQGSEAPNTEEIAKQAAAAAVAAVQGGTNESLIERVDPSMDEGDRIQQEIDQLADQVVYLQERGGDPQEIDELIDLITDLQDQLSDLEKDQMEHEAEYEDDDYWIDPAGGRHYGDEDDPAAMYEDDELEEKSDGPCWKGYEMIGMKEKGGKKVPNCVPESLDEAYASKFRPGKMEWKGRTYNINKVENVNDKMDIVYVDGKSMSSKHLESTGAEMVKKPRPEREKRMTKREYERTLKDTMRSVKSDMGDAIDHSIIYDLAENLYYDPEVKNYVARRWKKENGYTEWYDTREPSRHDIIEQITNDLEMNESFTAKKNFKKLEEAYVENKSKPDEDYIDEDYVFYVKINEDGNEFIGKIFKISPDGDWFGLVKEGESDTFQKISYEPGYDEVDIIKFLGENYDKVEIIDRSEYNDVIEDEENDIDEDIIGGSAWPSNSIASPGPKARYQD
jgi:hypothetical protein